MPNLTQSVQEIKIFRINLNNISLAEARKRLDEMGYIVLNWERIDGISDRIYYAYCVFKGGKNG